MGDEVYKGDDGYWRVRGQPETTYYPSEEIAAQIARELAGEPDDDGELSGDEDDDQGEANDDQGEADAHDGHDQIPETG